MIRLGLNRTVGGGAVCRVICRTSGKETTSGPCNMHQRFAGRPVPPSASLDGADNRTPITFTQAWDILVQVAQGAHRQSRGVSWDILWRTCDRSRMFSGSMSADPEQSFDQTLELSETLCATGCVEHVDESELTCHFGTDTATLANTMLSYSLSAALFLLSEKLTTAQASLRNVREDL
ncbi:BQ5605_C040g11845 [Microbotryum silenes-dioicae]|uniref:BQ5605_C040g11845 protein n=1 Tax=Microbotryum silenes-dioicae TaxID=796604 RepID=A0A2X0MU35_9BASI|nr:BQ5605_C040g11845 [Microbotryum silenes-dioicae]